MKVSALLTSAGINIALCAVLLSLYSVLRKQPGNLYVYFGRRIAQDGGKHHNPFSFERLVPSPSWIVKAWVSSEDDILSVAGLDAVVFIRILVFSIRIFSIAAVVCIFGVLPAHYYGQNLPHLRFSSESLDAFSITSVKEGSQWLWVHCLALYIISISACILLYLEYKNITQMRLAHFTTSTNPRQFTVLVRAIPRSTEEPFSDSVDKFFSNHHASSYLSHQIVYRRGKIKWIMKNAEKVYKKFIGIKNTAMEQRCTPVRVRCCLWGGSSNSLRVYRNFELDTKNQNTEHADSFSEMKECSAAFVFFKTRYAAVVASGVLQSSNPMLWVTDLAPEPHDVYWSNLGIPYRQLWLRRIATLLAAIVSVFVFILPVTFVQGLSQLEQLQQTFPFLRNILKKTFMIQLVTGYLPSVILMLFLYLVPPTMMLFSSVEGPISRSARKKSACCKVLYFTIWNVFFVNVLSGSVISQLNTFFNPKDIPNNLAKAVPSQATFFITYVLTSGWASLSSEVVQLFRLIYIFARKNIFRSKIDSSCTLSFPYHTEIPRVLLFGLLGFTCSILAPLILPFLLVYFFLGYIVYKNQILNVYCTKYETGGEMWPIVHNTTIFSLVLTQIIAIGVFGIKQSPIASGFAIPLVILTLLFNEYCRKRFYPVFKNISAQDAIEMDRDDEENGRMEGIHTRLLSAYCQFPPDEEAEEGTGEASQECTGKASQECTGVASQECTGVASQECKGKASQECTGVASQECKGKASQECTGEASQECKGEASQECKGKASQECKGKASQECTGEASQECKGAVSQSAEVGQCSSSDHLP